MHPMTQRRLMPRSGFRRSALLPFAAGLAVLTGADANAKDPGAEAYMIRVLSCVGADAAMELYLPQSLVLKGDQAVRKMRPDRKSTRLNSSHQINSYAVFCLKKKIKARLSAILCPATYFYAH